MESQKHRPKNNKENKKNNTSLQHNIPLPQGKNSNNHLFSTILTFKQMTRADFQMQTQKQIPTMLSTTTS